MSKEKYSQDTTHLPAEQLPTDHSSAADYLEFTPEQEAAAQSRKDELLANFATWRAQHPKGGSTNE